MHSNWLEIALFKCVYCNAKRTLWHKPMAWNEFCVENIPLTNDYQMCDMEWIGLCVCAVFEGKKSIHLTSVTTATQINLLSINVVCLVICWTNVGKLSSQLSSQRCVIFIFLRWHLQWINHFSCTFSWAFN